MESEFHTLSFDITDGIGHLVLNQPPGNRMTVEFFSEFNILTKEMKTMKGLKAIVISSSGRHFSSGADLDGLMDLVLQMQPEHEPVPEPGTGNEGVFEQNGRSFLSLEEAGIPVISAIRGVCIGSAFELALFSHFRFCGEDAVFGLPETTFNLIPGIGGIPRLANLCGTAKAIELVLKGNTFDAREALAYNLVDGILPKRQVVRFALDFAGRIMEGYRKEKKTIYLKKIHSDDPIHT
jgi:enoyl-CoA hydratase